jgi:hypothetical protein
MSRKTSRAIYAGLFVTLALSISFTEHRVCAQTVQATIPFQPVELFGYFGDDMGGIAVNPATNRIYAYGHFDNQYVLKVVDANDYSSIAIIPLGDMILGSLAINPHTNRIYVIGFPQVLKVIDGNSNSVVATVDLINEGYNLSMLRGPAIDTVANKIYVWSAEDIKKVLVIDGQTNEVTAIPVPSLYPAGTCPCSFEGPFLADNGMAVNSATHNVYMPLRDGGPDEFVGALLIIEGATNKATIMPLDFYPSGEIVVNPNTNRIYIAGAGGFYESVIGVIDGATNTLVDHIPLPVGYDVLNYGLSAMGINPSTNRIYKYGYEGFDKSMAIIDGNSDTVLSRSVLADSTLLIAYMAVNPNNSRIYTVGFNASDFEHPVNPFVAVINPGAAQLTSTGHVSSQVDAATLTFDNLTTPGSISVIPISDPATAGEVPGGFAISDSEAYEITKDVNLQFSGPVTICFSVPTVNDAGTFATLRVLHRELNASTGQYELVDRTTSSDFATHSVCATTTSFSPFYIARTGSKVKSLFDKSKAYKSGSTVPVKVQLLNAIGTNISSASTSLTPRGLLMIGGNTTASVTDSGNANSDGSFRYDPSLGSGGGYIFNLSTKGLKAGAYALSFFAGSDRSFFYTVTFEAK